MANNLATFIGPTPATYYAVAINTTDGPNQGKAYNVQTDTWLLMDGQEAATFAIPMTADNLDDSPLWGRYTAPYQSGMQLGESYEVAIVKQIGGLPDESVDTLQSTVTVSGRWLPWYANAIGNTFYSALSRRSDGTVETVKPFTMVATEVLDVGISSLGLSGLGNAIALSYEHTSTTPSGLIVTQLGVRGSLIVLRLSGQAAGISYTCEGKMTMSTGEVIVARFTVNTVA